MTARCLIEPAEWLRPECALTREQSHHLLRVLRARPGDRVALLDGQGGVAVAELVGARGGRATVRVLERRREPPPAVWLVLFQAVAKAQAMDWILQKAAEIGAREVVPMRTARSIPVLGEERRAESRRSRWQRIAAAAAEQSGSPWVMQVGSVTPFAEAVERAGRCDALLLASLAPGARALREVMGELRSRRPGRLGVLIGPEGDFEPAEIAAARGQGAVPVSLGSRVLRAETAALFVLSVLTCELAADGA
jgi:16S rRNA (uracil1498-N3)-methyltransferase